MGNKAGKPTKGASHSAHSAISEASESSHKEDVEAGVWNRKGIGYLKTQRFQDASAAFDESLKLRRMLNQENTAEYAWASLGYAVAQGHMRNRDSAQLFQDALSMFDKLNLTESPVFALGLADFGRYYFREKRFELGVKKMREALVVFKRIGDEKSKDYVDVLRDFAAAMSHVEDHASESVEICKTLLELIPPVDNIGRGRTMLVYAQAALCLGHKDDALKLVEEAVVLLSRHDPGEPTWLTRQKSGPHLEEADELIKKIKSHQ